MRRTAQHLLLILLPVMSVVAQVSKPSAPITPNVPGNQQASERPEASFLKITIDSSRSPITMDTQAGVSAEVKNVSTVAVRLFENETVFTTMPETRVYGEQQSIQGCATFPTQGNIRQAGRPSRGYDLLIQPGEAYRVFWDMTRNGCKDEEQKRRSFWPQPSAWFEEKWQRMMFAPGTYRVYLDITFYPEPASAASPAQTTAAPKPEAYHTATEGRDILVSASQQMVLLGAFIGGVLAYLIKVYYGVGTALTVKMQDNLPKKIIARAEVLVAGMFGGTIVILASRLSDTFPIKVNANDFWGAIALGFAFEWIGVKLLEKLPGVGPEPATAAPQSPSPTTTPSPAAGMSAGTAMSAASSAPQP